MSDETMDAPLGPESDEALLRLLETPDAPELEETRRYLAGSLEARASLRGLMAIEAALIDDAWRSAEAEVATEPREPLPIALRDSLLAIAAPAGAGRPALPTRSATPSLLSVSGAGARSRPRSTAMWGRVAAFAAAFLIAFVGVRAWLDDDGGTRMRGVPAAVGVAEADAPFTLIVQGAGAQATTTAAVRPSAGGWIAEVPMDAAIQLRVRPADGMGIDDAAGASLTVSLVGEGGARQSVGDHAFEAQLSGAAVDVPVGPTIHLASLASLGAAPGSRLELDVRRGDETLRLTVVLAPPSP